MQPPEPTDPTGRTCRNCGEPAGPHFCGHCGQAVEDRRQPLFELVAELIEEWVSLDSRLAHTLAALARPGRLTRAYLDGRRAPYLRPLRLYFLASLVLFSSALALRPPRADDVNLTVGDEKVTVSQAPGRYNLSLFAEDSSAISWAVDDVDATLDYLRSLPPQELLDHVFGGLRKVLPATLVLFVPVFAAVLKLLFVRARALYVDHLVFAVHIQSSLFIALALAWLVARLVGLGTVFSILLYALVALTTLVVYVPLALRHVYQQGRVLTLLKTGAILLCYGYLLRLAIGLSTLLVILTI